LHPIREEIPLESLVTGTYQHGTGPGRIVPLTIVASDGSVQLTGSRGRVQTKTEAEAYPDVVSRWVAWDIDRSEMVQAWDAESFEGPGLRWYPFIDAYAGGFADAACSIRIAITPACGFLHGSAALETWGSGGSACEPSTPTFLELGAAIPRGTVYREGLNQTCEPNDGTDAPALNQTRLAFTVGPPIPATAFANVAMARTGTKQLQLVQTGSAGGRLAGAVSFFDTVHDTRCWASGPDQPCLPETGPELQDETLFADAACSVFHVRAYTRGCATRNRFVGRSDPWPQWDGFGSVPLRGRHIYPLGDRHVGPTYINQAGACVPVETPIEVPTDEWDYFRVGPEIPAAEFAKVKLVRPE
jgi:hypothetical protein